MVQETTITTLAQVILDSDFSNDKVNIKQVEQFTRSQTQADQEITRLIAVLIDADAVKEEKMSETLTVLAQTVILEMRRLLATEQYINIRSTVIAKAVTA